MRKKLLGIIPDRSFRTRISQWDGHSQLTFIALTALICVMLLSYGFTYTVDTFTRYTTEKRQTELEEQSKQLAKLIRDIEELQIETKRREASLTQVYEQVLKREGRLTEKHIVRGDASRMVADDNMLVSRGGAAVSRSYSRYSPYHFDVTIPSAVTAHELESVLQETNLKGLGRSFIQAELNYGINAMFLTALAIHESRWGNSLLAQEKNNLFGFAAYDVDPFLYAETFTSKHECILTVAKFLRDNYISGQYSNGRNISDINQMYASDEEWSYKVFMLIRQIDRDIQEP